MAQCTWQIGLVFLICLWGWSPVLAQERGTESPHGPGVAVQCTDCHTESSWTPVRQLPNFDHNTDTRFELVGKHALTTCASCHVGLRFDAPRAANDACATCHVDVHQGRFSETCETCHNTESFSVPNAELLHSRTSFPLTGAHRQITCESCHLDDAAGAFRPLDTDCMACHTADYEQADNHIALGYPAECTQCHSTVAWSDGSFDHVIASGGFTLIGAHETAQCASCHSTPNFEVPFDAETPNDCIACHAQDYDTEHGGSGFTTHCLTCHNAMTWDGATFDHVTLSEGFVLVGAHETLNCESCHSGPDFDVPFTPADQNDCISCHAQDYEAEHGGTGIPTTCLTCHNTTAWEGITFDHAALSDGFALVGAHEALNCESCHAAPNFEVPFSPAGQNDCISCHASDYEAEHGGSGYPTACLTCHNVNNWEEAIFNHAAVANGFALVGAHEAITCESCHSGADFSVPFSPADQNDCISCHAQDYEEEHSGSGFPHDVSGVSFQYLLGGGRFRSCRGLQRLCPRRRA